MTYTLATTLFLAATPGCGEKSPPPTAAESDAPAAADLGEARDLLARGDAEGAASLAWQAVKGSPADPEARLVLAAAYQLSGRHQDALAQADKALALGPQSTGTHLTRAAALAGLKRYEAAIRAVQRVLALDPEHKGALRNLASFHAAGENWDAQREALQRLITLDEGDLKARIALARAYLNQGDIEGAERAARAVIDLNPRHLDAQLVLAALAFDRGDFLATMERAQIALKLDASHPLANDLFRAGFYVAAASKLFCRHGKRPWSAEAVDAVLLEFARDGLGGVEVFTEWDRLFASDATIQRRVESAQCPATP